MTRENISQELKLDPNLTDENWIPHLKRHKLVQIEEDIEEIPRQFAPLQVS
jgi:hypothetical protein